MERVSKIEEGISLRKVIYRLSLFCSFFHGFASIF